MIVRFLKKHSWIITAFFAIVLFPQSISLQSKLDGRLIITALAIDKLNSGYLVTAQIVSPSSGSIAEGENAGLDYISVSTKTIREAINQLSTRVGKSPGLAHMNCIIMGSSVFDEDVANLLDFIVRESHTDTSMLLLCAKNATQTLKTFKDLELGTAVDLRKTYLSKQRQSNGVLMVTNEFISNKLNPSSTSVLNYIEIETENQNTTQSGQSQSGQSPDQMEGQSSQNGGASSSGTPTKQGRLKYISPIALFKNGMHMGELETENEILGYTISYPHSKQLIYGFENIDIAGQGNCKVTLQSKGKSSKISCKIENGKPVVSIAVSLKQNQVLEIISPAQDTTPIYKSQKNNLTKSMRKQMEEQIKEMITQTFNKSKSVGVDLYGAATNLYRHHNKDYNAYMKTHTLNDFIADLSANITVKVESSVK